jgi:Transposase
MASDGIHECRRRLQQQIHGHRGRKTDPLYRIRNLLRAGQERLTDRQRDKLHTAFTADERHVEVEVAYYCAQQLRSIYHQTSHAAGRRIAIQVLDTSPAARSPKSPASDAPCDSGAASSSATSTPAAPTTAAPKRSTDSSSSTAASPAASATSTTTDSHAPDRRRTHPPPPQKGRAG